MRPLWHSCDLWAVGGRAMVWHLATFGCLVSALWRMVPLHAAPVLGNLMLMIGWQFGLGEIAKYSRDRSL